ncbi:MAG: hypothetical protein ACK5I7_07030 [Anaerotignum sp.]
MEEKEQTVTVCDDYVYYTPSGKSARRELLKTKDGEIYEETTIFANHFAKVLCVKIIDDGVVKNQIIQISVFCNGKWSEVVDLSQKDALSNNPNAFFEPGCRVYPWVRASKALQIDMIQAQCEVAERAYVNQHTGYKTINGNRVFLNAINSITEDGKSPLHQAMLPGQMSNYGFLPDEDKSSERYRTLLFMFCDDFPAPNELMFAGVAFAFLTSLNGLLREILLEPRFVLYFIGSTGCGKTSMANWFLNFFGIFSYNSPAPTNFSSTKNANERIYGIADSVLVSLDDKHPTGTTQAKANQSDVEQGALRGSGDKAARARLNADSTMKASYQMKCNLIITAEEAYTEVGESAIARSISVDLKPGDIRLDGKNSMVDMWHNAKHLNQCMGEFIQYVLCNWDSLQARARQLFDTINPKARTGGHNRLAETITFLQMGITFMCDWLISAEVINNDKAEMIQEQSWSIFKKMSENQNQKITSEKPEQMFVTAIKEMLAQNTIRVIKLGHESDYTNPSKVGFYDGNYYYFYPQAIFIKVKEFYSLQGRSFPLGQAALFSHLANEEMIEVDRVKNGKIQSTKGKRIKGVADGKTVRYLWLRAIALQENEEEKENE